MKYLFIFSLLMMPYHPLKQTTQRKDAILVYGDHLSMAFLIEIIDEQHTAVYTLPMTLVLPDACGGGYPLPIGYQNDRECLIDTVESIFPFHIDDSVYLYTEAMEADLTFSLHAEAIESFADMQQYFDELSQQVNLSLLWQIGNYMDYHFSLSTLWEYYHIYRAENLEIDYYFLHLFEIDALHSVALDTRFYAMGED